MMKNIQINTIDQFIGILHQEIVAQTTAVSRNQYIVIRVMPFIRNRIVLSIVFKEKVRSLQ